MLDSISPHPYQLDGRALQPLQLLHQLPPPTLAHSGYPAPSPARITTSMAHWSQGSSSGSSRYYSPPCAQVHDPQVESHCLRVSRGPVQQSMSVYRHRHACSDCFRRTLELRTNIPSRPGVGVLSRSSDLVPVVHISEITNRASAIP